MPELPEAETIARQLQARIAKRRLGEVICLRKDMVRGERPALAKILPGSRVERVYRRAKRVILDLSDADGRRRTLVFTLGMTGSVMVNKASDPVEKHTHLRLAVADGDEEIRFSDPRRFGGIWLQSQVNGEAGPFAESRRRKGAGCKKHSLRKRVLGSVGPEPLELKPREFTQLLRRKRAIKSLLMDQTIIAGLGNIYCDESLFAAGIHPLRQADSLNGEEAQRLLRAIKSTLRRAIRFNGSTFMDYRSADGEPGSFQRFHKVYGRGGEPCRACGRPIERIIVGGRSSWFCGSCQPYGPNRSRTEPGKTPTK